MMRLVTVRMRGQGGLTKCEEDEMSGDSVWMTVRQKGRGMEDHVWVISVIGEQRKGREWVTGE
jgi:hypothetical protein